MGGGSCSMSGGGVSVQADLIDMRRTATALDRTGDEAGTLCASLTRTASRLPAKSALMSPGSAADVAQRVAALTAGPSGLGALALRMEVVSRGIRVGARAYEIADDVNRRAMEAISIVTAPVHVGMAVAGSAATATVATTVTALHDPGSLTDRRTLGLWGRVFAADLGRRETADPHLTGDGITTIRELFWLARPDVLDFDSQVGLLLGIGRATGRFDDAQPLTVTAVDDATPRATVNAHDLGDLILQEADVESSTHSNDDHTTVRVHHVTHEDGSAAWVVDIPGTQNWQTGGPHNPFDGTGNITTMAGVPASIYPAVRSAMRRAMSRAGVVPGSEPVMLVGHSQGGIVATRMMRDRAFRTEFDVTRVVTVAAPVTRMEAPEGVRTLEIEHTGDLVPGLDADYAPDAANSAQVSCDPVHITDNPLDQHHASTYVTTAREHLGRDSGLPMVQRFYDDSDIFFDGRDTAYDYTVRRP